MQSAGRFLLQRGTPKSLTSITLSVAAILRERTLSQVVGRAGDHLDREVLVTENEQKEVLAGMNSTVDPVCPERRFLSAREVGALIGVRARRVYELEIPCIRISPRCVRWVRGDVLRWLSDRRAA